MARGAPWRPRSCSVVGFDDLSYAEHLDPPLTTVRQPLTDIGRVGGARTPALLGRPGASVESAMLPVHLMVRRSTGRPPGEPAG